ncbi:MSH6 [Symbiodinium pilosum]|uniref:MSH6 protein n=1 Tax=Symbiodinium pilosum TaxID=2952 RepID=A0A812LW49_SYMPI|nr:MSH6 [Symbiodinium pilosum]
MNCKTWLFDPPDDPLPLPQIAGRAGQGEVPRVDPVSSPGKLLQAMPRFLQTTSQEDGPDLPIILPMESSGQQCLDVLTCICAVLAVVCFCGIIVCVVMLIFNEAMPFACPSHHVVCQLLEHSANPQFRATVLSVFTLCVVCLPLALASCQGQCMCLQVVFRDGGLVSQAKRCRDACFKRLAAAPSDIARRVRSLRSLKKPSSRVHPSQEGPRQLPTVCFGAQDFSNFAIVPVPQLSRMGHKTKQVAEGFPRRWCQMATLPCREVVELSPFEGEGAEVAALVLKDATWHQPPRCEQVLRVQNSSAWAAYNTRKAQLLSRRSWSGEDDVPLTALDRLNFCADELDSRLNEQFLLCGTTVELAEYAQTTGEVVASPECPRHQLQSLGGGVHFCSEGFIAHEQATDAGYSRDGLESAWAVLVCRVLVGRPLRHSGRRGGPRLHRDWESGRFGSLLLGDNTCRTEIFIPMDAISSVYPEYVIILR